MQKTPCKHGMKAEPPSELRYLIPAGRRLGSQLKGSEALGGFVGAVRGPPP